MKFVNPYNFVPLKKEAPDQASKNQYQSAQNSDEGLTGRIDYTITTLTPLFIPNTSNDRIFGYEANDGNKTDADGYHKNYDFFSYHDLSQEGSTEDNCKKHYEPVIPGSEIRGAVRSLYEALTDSCLMSMQKPSVIARRTPETYKAGVLIWNEEKTGISLCYDESAIPVNDLLYRDPKNKYNVRFLQKVKEQGFHDGQKIYYKLKDGQENRRGKKLVAEISKEKPDSCTKGDWFEGWVVIGEKGPVIDGKTKHCVHVFTKSSKTDKLDQRTEEVRENLLACIEAYQGNNSSAYEDYKKSAEDFFNRKADGLPVYYSCIRIRETDGESANEKSVLKKHYYWSPACITREVYYHKLDECVRGYAACTDTDHLCPACSLFGILSQKSGAARGSKVRFSDATVKRAEETARPANAESINSQYYADIVTLPELATPKIQSTEFYLRRPEGVDRLMTWTYDYYIVLDDNNVPKVHWYTGKTDEPVISGRKFYWHSKEGYEENVLKRQTLFEKQYRTIRNETVRPVKAGISFEGSLYFNDISKKELDRLITIMNMSSSDGNRSHYAMKLGAGKPIGMGSVDLTIKKVVVRDTLVGYSETSENDRKIMFTNDLFSDLDALKYLNFDALTAQQVAGYLGTESWPEEGSEGFNWFMHNREHFKRGQSDTVNKDEFTKSPNKRSQEHFAEYLKDGYPETYMNYWDRKAEDEALQEEYRAAREKIIGALEKGTERTGTVIASDNNARIKVHIDNGGEEIFIKYNENDAWSVQNKKLAKKEAAEWVQRSARVKLRYYGTEPEDPTRPIWRCVSIEK